jgi:multidrug transporter EmrE-like cation transporter
MAQRPIHNTSPTQQNVILLSIIMFIVAFEASAQYCVKMSRTTDNLLMMVPAVAFYGLVCGGLYCSYAYRGMGMVNVAWSALSVVAITSVGAYFYHERINGNDLFGMILIFIGLYYVFVEGHQASLGTDVKNPASVGVAK